MLTRMNLSARPLAAALAALSFPLTLALAAGEPDGIGCPGSAASCSAPSCAARIDAARAAASEGRVVEAKSSLLDLLSGPQAGKLTDEDRAEAYAALASITERIRAMNPMDISLQKADLALSQGDVRTAELQSDAVAGSASASEAQKDRAKDIARKASHARAAIAPKVPSMVARAARDFEAGKYAEAKAALETVQRSGVVLAGTDQAIVDLYQGRIIDLERAQGSPVDSRSAAMGMMQAGTVERHDDQPEGQESQPVAQPETPPMESTPVPPEDWVQISLKVDAQSILAEADRAFDEARLNEAATKYVQLRDLYKDYLTAAQLEHVNSRLAEARVKMQSGVGGQVPTLGPEIKLQRDQALAEFANAIDQGKRAAQTGDISGARIYVAQAGLILNTNRAVLSEAEYEARRRDADALSVEVERQDQALAESRQKAKEADITRAATEAQDQAKKERQARINTLLEQARAYQLEMRYDEAIQSIDQLLFLDPINPAGLVLKDVLEDTQIFRAFSQADKTKLLDYTKQSIANNEAVIPPEGIVNYPPDWPKTSFLRGEPVQFAESPENRKVLGELRKRIPAVEFNDNTLADALEFVRKMTNQNMDVDWSSLEQVGVQRETTLSLRLTNVRGDTLLDRIIEKAGGSTGGPGGAAWAVSDGIIRIASKEAINKDVVLVIYDIRDLLLEVPNYYDAPQIDLQQALQASQSGGGGGGQSPFQQEQEQQQTREEQERRKEDRRKQIIDIIQQNVDPDGWKDLGGDVGYLQPLDGNLIIRNTPRNHREIAGLLTKLRDVRSMQINVETRFLLVKQDFFEAIGFDLDVYFDANNNQVRQIRATNPTAQTSDFFVDGKMVRSVSTPALGPAVPPLANVANGINNPERWSPIGVTQAGDQLAGAIAPSSDWSNAILSAAPALAIAGQFIDDVQVDFLIQATQADRRSISMSAPRLTFTNGQTSNIYVVTQQAFVSDLQPIVSDSAVGFDPTISVVSEGVVFLVEGTVAADRRYVQLNVDAGIARIDGFAQQPVTAVAGGQLVNSADTRSFIQLPTVTVTRVRTTVSVPDQGTVLLGGQRIVTEYEVETGVPVLSKIPIINRFFTNRIQSKEEQTLLILIKPTILIQNEQEERNFPGLADQLRAGG